MAIKGGGQMKTFGEILKEKRKAIGMTIAELAGTIGVDKNTLYYWEKGKTYPSIIYACDLADIFNCTLDELVGRERNPVCVDCGKQPSEEESLLCYECNRLTT